jgi:acetate kinase
VRKVYSGVENLGVLLDKEANKNAITDTASRMALTESKVQIWVVPTDEESIILNEVLALV